MKKEFICKNHACEASASCMIYAISHLKKNNLPTLVMKKCDGYLPFKTTVLAK